MKHQLKTWPKYFQRSWIGDKPFEIRENDRNFQESDEVVLLEYELSENNYTGREIHGFIRYVTNFEQKPGHVVFSIIETNRVERR